MYLWKRIDEENCLKYIKNNIETDEKLSKFLKTFIHYSYSQTMGDYTEKKTRKLNYKAIKDFIDVESIVSNVKSIDNDLGEVEKFCIDSFIGFYENKLTNDEF
jgi:hypothetical protein